MNDLLKKINIKSDRCFVIGNGPSLNSVDLNLLENEFTIVCNNFMEGLTEKNKFFLPNIICGGDAFMIKDFVNVNFQFDNNNTYDKIKNKLIYIFHMSSFIANCYDINTWVPLCSHWNTRCNCKFTLTSDIKKLAKIMDENKNIYMLKQFEPFELSHDIYELIGNNRTDLEKKNIITKNYRYCIKYHNVIPMISLLIAKELGFKYIYLLGCDGVGFDKHFYDKLTGITLIDTMNDNFKTKYYGDIYKAMESRNNEFLKLGIKLINCASKSVYNFLPIIDFPNFVKSLNDNNDDIIQSFHNYCIDFITKNSDIQTFRNLNSTITNEMLDETVYDINNIISQISRERCFIFGNEHNLSNMDIFKHEFTISCNFMNNKFIPNIICHEFGQSMVNQENNDSTIHIYNIFSLINAIYEEKILHNIKSYSLLESFENFKNNICKNQRTYIIKDFSDIKLTNDIDSLFDNIELIKKNMSHCEKYENNYLLTVLLIAKQLKFKYIYLVGCDSYIYNKKMYEDNNIVNGFGTLYNEFKNNDIQLINCSHVKNNLIKTVNLYNIINRTNDQINKLHSYVKIDETIKNGSLDKSLLNRNNLTQYYEIQKIIK